MRNRNDQILEDIMNQAARKQGQNDDVYILSVEVNGKEIPIMENRREVEFIHDPDNGDIPMIVNRRKYNLDDNGRKFSKEAAACKFGCCVNADSLFVCRHCHSFICQKHVMLICSGARAYCRKGVCAVVGRLYQTLWTIYRISRYCLYAMTGMNDEPGTKNRAKHPFDVSESR